MRRFYTDLKAAGICRVDAQGRMIDWHSTRHTTAALLSRSGVSPRTAQEIMRHSDRRPANILYTDATQLPILDAMARLPRCDNEQSKVTGGKVKPRDQEADVEARITLGCTKACTTEPALWHPKAHFPAQSEKLADAKNMHNSQENAGFCATVQSAGKMRPLGIEPDGNAAKTPENPQKTNSVAPKVAPSSNVDPDFAMVAEFWAQLPAAIKAGIVAMVRTAMRIGNQS